MSSLLCDITMPSPNNTNVPMSSKVPPKELQSAENIRLATSKVSSDTLAAKFPVAILPSSAEHSGRLKRAYIIKSEGCYLPPDIISCSAQGGDPDRWTQDVLIGIQAEFRSLRTGESCKVHADESVNGWTLSSLERVPWHAQLCWPVCYLAICARQSPV